MEKPLLEIKNLSKSFGVTRALQDVSFSISKGTICGLVGENGSGKSTLSSIIAGMQGSDSGELILEERVFTPHNISDASSQGVSMVVQEKGTINKLTVAENIFIGKEEQFLVGNLISKKKMNEAADSVLKLIGAEEIKSEAMIDELNFEECKIVEIARAMENNPRLLIIDETTTAIAHKGRELLYKLIKEVKKNGQSVLFITHDLDELQMVSDEIVVLRDGCFIGKRVNQNLDVQELKAMMVGREVSDNFYRNDYSELEKLEPALCVENLTLDEKIQEITFTAHKGEILGLGGLSECGMHEIGKALFGLIKPITGKVTVADKNISVRNASQAKKLAIAYLSKNRDKDSVLLNTSVVDNIVLPSISSLSRAGLLSKRKEKNFAKKWANELEVKCKDVNQYVSELSGGNKQKVAIAKWLGKGSDIFIFDCPTRGIDIGVKESIYHLMEALRAQGKSIVMISEEMPELIGMSDRIIIIKDGRISGELKRSVDLVERDVIQYMI
ncbi:sugar ABC transporter ATP-binding protein [Ohessyouella blattaphilus]|uniref:Sugar ABC transporter ATP-binding protein n=1 Tax=Ohessyouella blattaphilus TaxID=2949333 RepID=A0ABT1EML4_9FIRM|nr:sugar ABC transporter ATP-binding protein [Ohessyouella blattaphilus]MCP1110522.1 sugar ABC transporter ATP-binding protein [Ohessyouella blattaphilus]MCR8563916.1 sugar ABC transporter ATP-binding protein [Ohessyouella blattaphilus]MDL2249480.1 sugar ABC transporter ATP-binding protein [Lachnospiraceae bacterium OttesenSCG-928-J05]